MYVLELLFGLVPFITALNAIAFSEKTSFQFQRSLEIFKLDMYTCVKFEYF